MRQPYRLEGTTSTRLTNERQEIIRKMPYGQPQQHQSKQQEITFKHDRRGLCAWILNFLWVAVAGWHLFTTWFVAGLILCCTCIGIPCGWQAIKISIFLLFPFGKSLMYTHEQVQGEGGRCCMRSCNCLLNVLWAVTVGWIFALQALLSGILLMMTIIGIPFGWQCFKLCYLCLCPFGMDFTAEAEETVFVKTTTPIPQYYTAAPF